GGSGAVGGLGLIQACEDPEVVGEDSPGNGAALGFPGLGPQSSAQELGFEEADTRLGLGPSAKQIPPAIVTQGLATGQRIARQGGVVDAKVSQGLAVGLRGEAPIRD